MDILALYAIIAKLFLESFLLANSNDISIYSEFCINNYNHCEYIKESFYVSTEGSIEDIKECCCYSADELVWNHLF